MADPVPAAARKDAGYYENRREDVVARLPLPIGSVLDVGCGGGAVAETLRARGATRVVGIELDPVAAARARERCDLVFEGSVEAALERIDESFDTICCYDVLEHLVDPWKVLVRLRERAAPGGRLHVSLPNARHLSLVYDLVVRGTFGYADFGHRDNTHLRWFTRSDLLEAIEGARWSVRAVAHSPLSRPRRAAGRLTRGRSDEFVALQWFVLAAIPGR